MKIVQINAVCGTGSTGKISVAVSRLLTKAGADNHILYCGDPSDYPLGIRYAGNLYIKGQALKSRILGNYGFNSVLATKKLIRILDRLKPDIVHLHNLHSHNCHLEMLFSHLRKMGVKICWTFHDCWAFTGYCPHFDMAGCDAWQRDCGGCTDRRFTWFFRRAAGIYRRKKGSYADLPMTIITPSRWLAGCVQDSFFEKESVRVIPNGINLSVFRPRPSNFRQRHGCDNKFILLGVAFGWDARKGLDVFAQLARRLDPRFQIVLVGVDEKTERLLPENVIAIRRTQNQQELAEIYSAADLFVNPTREENYPTVNMEALACGTPVVTFNTGGSPEMLDDTCGAVVARNDIDALEREILRIYTEKPFSSERCCARAEAFDENRCYGEYLRLYEELCHE